MPGPSAGHPLGLDPFGSDLLTQLIYGARQSLIIGVVSTSLGLIGGAAARARSPAAFGGWVDTLVMRIVDILLSIPSLLLAVSVAAVLGQHPLAIMIAIARRPGADLRPAAARLDAGPARPGLRAGRVLAGAAPAPDS